MQPHYPPQRIVPVSQTDTDDKLVESIDTQLKELPADNRIVTLRIDEDVCFADAQYALAGVAASSATDIQLAVLKDRHTASE